MVIRLNKWSKYVIWSKNVHFSEEDTTSGDFFLHFFSWLFFFYSTFTIAQLLFNCWLDFVGKSYSKQARHYLAGVI